MRDFSEVVRLTGCHVELDIAYLEVRGALEDPSPQLEEGQKELLLNKAQFSLICTRVEKVLHDCINITKEDNLFELIHTKNFTFFYNLTISRKNLKYFDFVIGDNFSHLGSSLRMTLAS